MKNIKHLISIHDTDLTSLDYDKNFNGITIVSVEFQWSSV